MQCEISIMQCKIFICSANRYNALRNSYNGVQNRYNVVQNRYNAVQNRYTQCHICTELYRILKFLYWWTDYGYFRPKHVAILGKKRGCV
jgi:hypothetical protein